MISIDQMTGQKTMLTDPGAVAAIELGIVVRSPERMLGFYRDILGMEPYGEVCFDGIYVRGLRLANSILKLTWFEANTADRVPDEGFPPGLRYLTFRVSDIQSIYDRSLAAGRPVVLELEHTTSQQGVVYKHAIVRDPEGNLVEFVEGNAYAPPGEAF